MPFGGLFRYVHILEQYPKSYSEKSKTKGIESEQAINIVTDLFILALPIKPILGLQLSFKPKVYLVMMFSVGIV
jgi:hypothetical protein